MKLRIIIDAHVKHARAIVGLEHDLQTVLREHGLGNAKIELRGDPPLNCEAWNSWYPSNASYSTSTSRDF